MAVLYIVRSDLRLCGIDATRSSYEDFHLDSSPLARDLREVALCGGSRVSAIFTSAYNHLQAREQEEETTAAAACAPPSWQVGELQEMMLTM